MYLTAITIIHVVISLVGIFSGFVVLWGLLKAKPLPGWTKVFLWTTVLTSVTGYFFPVHKVLPSHIVGAISLVVLALCIYALRVKRLAGGWRKVYVITAVTALYLNVFVGVVQSFLKIAPLNALAPKGSEPPFQIAQLIVLVVFIAAGTLATIKFKEIVEEAESRA